jgi:hypothetical protein
MLKEFKKGIYKATSNASRNSRKVSQTVQKKKKKEKKNIIKASSAINIDKKTIIFTSQKKNYN